VEHEVPEEGLEGGGWGTPARSGPPNMHGYAGRGVVGCGGVGPRSHVGIDAAASVGEQTAAEAEGEDVVQVAARVSSVAKGILGPANVGTRILCVHDGKRQRRHGPDVHRKAYGERRNVSD